MVNNDSTIHGAAGEVETLSDSSRREQHPCLMAELSGVSGRLKSIPEDFVVEEIPAFPLTGEGNHLYLLVEKRDLSHEQMLRHVATALRIPRGDIGTAGMKDRRAVTRQFISVPASCEPLLPSLETDSLRVLSATRHPTKLKTGKLKGNRFSILLRDVPANAAALAGPIRERLLAVGFPNYFGSQRFGTDHETLSLGFALLRGEKRPGDLPGSRRKFLLRLSLSAVQSWLFNRCLAERIAAGDAARVIPGDVLQVCASGGLFVSEQAAIDQQRLGAGEVAVTGPMFGPKMKLPLLEPFRREQAVLEQSQLALDAFARFPKLTAGTRRPYLMRPASLEINAEPDGLRFEFALPAGSYATELLREFVNERY
jgi:tRNA pseudouridine13 synthase